jgi:5-methylcytosine-specific restriction endonuclease McrA
MTNANLSSLSDRELLNETRRAAETERQTTAALVSLLAEVDARRLYFAEGYSSLFGFCTRVLRLSEPAAYARITAARTARRFPVLFSLLGDGAISLTTVGLLAAHLTDENHEAILDAARDKSKREVERVLAAIQPQPDIPSSVRALPTTPSPAKQGESPEASIDGMLVAAAAISQAPEILAPAATSTRRDVVAPIAPMRYLMRITVSEETHRKFQRARDLLRHQIPDGDPATIVDRARTVLLERVERAKFAATKRYAPRERAQRLRRPATGQSAGNRSRARRIPAAVRRTVWARDAGQCAFVGGDGRCGETGFLEFHHVVPFAAGGPSTGENLQLRCRAHNAYEATRDFGDRRLRSSTPSGRSCVPTSTRLRSPHAESRSS